MIYAVPPPGEGGEFVRIRNRIRMIAGWVAEFVRIRSAQQDPKSHDFGYGRADGGLGMWKRLWQDDAGTLLTSEYLILGTLLTLGIVVGVSATRDTLVSEYEDYAAAIMGLWKADWRHE
jgi:hypothetical protein